MQGPLQQENYLSEKIPEDSTVVSSISFPSNYDTIDDHNLSPMQSLFKQIRYYKVSDLDESSQINFFNLVSHLLSEVCSTDNKKDSIASIVRIFVSKITLTNPEMYSGSASTIKAIKMWKFFKMTPSAIQTCSFLACYIIEEIDENNFHELIMLYYFNLQLGVEMNTKTLQLINCSLRRCIYKRRVDRQSNIKDEDKLFEKELGAIIVNKIIKAPEQINTSTFKIYINCLILTINNIDTEDVSLLYLKQHFVSLPLIQFLAPQERGNNNSIAQEYQEERENLFLSICVCFFKTGSKMLFEAAKYMIDCGTTTLMVHNLWNCLNPDVCTYESDNNLRNFAQLIAYLKQKNKEETKYCALATRGCWALKSIHKKISLFVLECQITHPRMMSKSQKNVIAQLQMENGIIEILVDQINRNNNNCLLLLNKYNREDLEKRKPSESIQIANIQSCLLEIALQFKSESKFVIFFGSQSTEIVHAWLGLVKNILVGAMKQYRSAVKNILSFITLQNTSYEKFLKDRPQIMQNFKSQAPGPKSSLLKKLTSINQSPYDNQLSLLDYLQMDKDKGKKQKISSKVLDFEGLHVTKNQNYISMVNKFDGKSKIGSYILNVLQIVKQDKIIQVYLDVVLQEWLLLPLSDRDVSEVQFLYGFSLFRDKPVAISNKLLEFTKNVHTQKKSKSRTEKSLNQKLQLQLKSVLEDNTKRDESMFEKQIMGTVQSYLQNAKLFSKEDETKCYKKILNTLVFSLWRCVNDYSIKIDQQILSKSQMFQNLHQSKNLNVNINNVQIIGNALKLSIDFQRFALLGKTINLIMSKVQQHSQSESLVLQILSANLQFLLIVLSNILIDQKIYIPQILLQILKQNYENLSKLSAKTAEISIVPQPQIIKICTILSQVFNLLPNLCLYQLCVLNQANSAKKQMKFYKIYNSNKERSKNDLHKDGFYSLMTNYYFLGFQIGSFAMKSKPLGFLTYMGHAYRFMNQYKHNMNWDENQDILSLRDRIMITEIYICCWKFIFNNFYAKNVKKYYEFDVEIQAEAVAKLSDLCLPIYFVEKPKNNRKIRSILQQILKFYILSGTCEQFPFHILVNLEAGEYQKLFKTIKTQIDNKMPPKKDERVFRDILLMTIANSAQKSIDIQIPPAQDYQSQEKYQQFVRIYEWYRIYNKIKYIHHILKERQGACEISNYHHQPNLESKLIEIFQDMLEIVSQHDYYENLRYLIENFVSDHSKQTENQSINQVKYYIPFLQLLLNQCRQINKNPKLRLTLNRKQKKKQSNLFTINTKQINTYFYLEMTQITQDLQQIETSSIKMKLFSKIINANRSYFTEMYFSLNEIKNNVLFAYYGMIEKLLIQQKINRAGSSTKYNQFEHYVLDDWLSSENVNVMLKRDPVSILDNLIRGEIPRLHSNNKPYFHTLYAIKMAKSLLDLNKSIFFEVSSQNEHKPETLKQKGVISMPAFLITKSKIYQGSLEVNSSLIKFIENSFIDKQAYQKLYANKSQQRTYQQITVSKKEVQINVVEIVYCEKKKYLQKFPSLQIFAENLSYFFVFNQQETRKRLLAQAHLPIRQRPEEYAELVNELKQNWVKGWMNNFHLITAVNNIAGRSFNDVSQYYVFPWTVTNFEGKMDVEFLKNKTNFRDLNKPIGAQNPKKLQMVLNKYAMIVCDGSFYDIPYIYGSFYSNPAIVCNYLLRVNPFTTHHYQLQGNQFDQYDRLFTDVEDQYRSIYNSVFDNRELTPQFYSAPQFFRNRNKFNFAHNNSETNKVDLSLKMPQWVITGSAEEFVFRMRKALQSDVVSAKLGSWIDLIFGFKSEKELAAEYHNLYIDELYTSKKNSKGNPKTQSQLTRSEIQKKAHMIKQFGQVPRNIFGSNPSMKSNYYHIAQNIFNKQIFMRQLQVFKAKKPEKNSSQTRVIFDFYDSTLAISQRGKLIVLHTIEEVKKLEIDIEKQFQSLAIMGLKKTKNIIVFAVTTNQNAIVYAITRGFKDSLLISKQSFMLQATINLAGYSRVSLVKTIGDKAVITRNSEIIVLQVSKQDKQSTICTLIQKCFYLNTKKSICLHQSRIVVLETYSCLDLVVSVDSNNLVNVFSINPSLIVRSTFSLAVLRPCEIITKLLVHQMGIIAILTNFNQLVIYNIYGDLIQRVKLVFNEVFSDLIFWDHTNSAQVVMSTKNGSLFQFDIFDLLPPKSNFKSMPTVDLKQKQKIQINGNNKLVMHRFGRYWEIYFIESLSQVRAMQCEGDFNKKYINKKILQNCNRNNTYSNS